jgi:dihydroneopterin aldolase
MMDKIVMDGIQVACLIGTRPEERQARQPVIVGVTLHGDWRAAAASDDLNDAVNYVRALEAIRNVAASASFFLLEALAAEMSRQLLAIPGVCQVDLRLEKPQAIPGVRVAVEISRQK